MRGSYSRRLRAAAREDPFATVEALLVAATVVGAVGALVLAGFAGGTGGVLGWALRAATVTTLVGPVALVVVLLCHACSDARHLLAGDRWPDTAVGYARAGWRTLETVAVLVYVPLAALSLEGLARLPDTEAAGTFVWGVFFFLSFGVVVLVVLVAVRVTAMLVYRRL